MCSYAGRITRLISTKQITRHHNQTTTRLMTTKQNIVPLRSAMVASRNLWQLSRLAAHSHCCRLSGYSLTLNSCRTLELTTSTVTSRLLSGTSSLDRDLQHSITVSVNVLQSQRSTVWKQFLNSQCLFIKCSNMSSYFLYFSSLNNMLHSMAV